MRYTVEPATGPINATMRVPGDKSISHRAVLFSAMAEGTSHAFGVLDSADVRCSSRRSGRWVRPSPRR